MAIGEQLEARDKLSWRECPSPVCKLQWWSTESLSLRVYYNCRVGQKSSVISGVQIQEIRKRDLQISPPLQLLLWEILRPISTQEEGELLAEKYQWCWHRLFACATQNTIPCLWGKVHVPICVNKWQNQKKPASFTTRKQYLAKNSRARLGFFLGYSSRPPVSITVWIQAFSPLTLVSLGEVRWLNTIPGDR